MKTQLPLAVLIDERMKELGICRQALGRRLGYHNPIKGVGRVEALCSGHLANRKSIAALSRLPAALEMPLEIVERALVATRAALAEDKRQGDEELRIADEADEAEWRAVFRPHGVIQTERTIPSQITICGLTGGAAQWLHIEFDLSRSPITYVSQAVDALPKRTRLDQTGRRYVMFFGEALGLVVNYSPDHAIRCDLKGTPLEVLPKAYRLAEVMLTIGGRPVSPQIAARLLNIPSCD